ncbi:MAG: hypothetical protein AB7F35_26130 [Acetobacteraceae bacterium]
MAEQRNEGEGNKTAAREYNQAQKDFVNSGKVEGAAEQAARDVDGPEGEALRRAEEKGKAHSHGEDPAVKQR